MPVHRRRCYDGTGPAQQLLQNIGAVDCLLSKHVTLLVQQIRGEVIYTISGMSPITITWSPMLDCLNEQEFCRNLPAEHSIYAIVLFTYLHHRRNIGEIEKEN